MGSLNLQLSKIISVLKISYQNKYLIVKYKKNTLLINLLNCFLKENVIAGYVIKKEFCYIYLKYNNLGEPLIKNFKILYKRPFETHFTIFQLKSKQFVKKYLHSSDINLTFCIFSTNKGILSYSECIRENAGGVLLLYVSCV